MVTHWLPRPLPTSSSAGDTALHLAAHGINVIRGRQHKEVHQLLKSATISILPHQVVSRLLSAGASVNIERKNGRRPFELTKSKEIRALLEPGAVCANIGEHAAFGLTCPSA